MAKGEKIENKGLVGLMDKRVTFFCANYIYRGVLIGIADDSVKLAKAQVVYETGPFDKKEWQDAQSIGGDWYVARGAIESYGLTKSDLE